MADYINALNFGTHLASLDTFTFWNADSLANMVFCKSCYEVLDVAIK